jgi:hypothetical protein
MILAAESQNVKLGFNAICRRTLPATFDAQDFPLIDLIFRISSG